MTTPVWNSKPPRYRLDGKEKQNLPPKTPDPNTLRRRDFYTNAFKIIGKMKRSIPAKPFN
ncbi:hypothetical protein N9N03_01530 [Chlamydiia bacterium]|nr:hypothetical protein [Chlamydiia bacterium]